MIRRLIEADIYKRDWKAPGKRIGFRLKECRTPELPAILAERYPQEANTIRKKSSPACSGHCQRYNQAEKITPGRGRPNSRIGSKKILTAFEG